MLCLKSNAFLGFIGQLGKEEVCCLQFPVSSVIPPYLWVLPDDEWRNFFLKL